MLHVVKVILIIGFLASGVFSSRAQAQIAVISHTSSTVDNLSLAELHRIYTGDVTTFSPVCVQKELSDQFFGIVLGQDDYAVKRLWIRLLLSGKVSRGPVGLRSDEDVVEYVRRHPGTIGFISLRSVSEAVKVIRIDGVGPAERTYVLKEQRSASSR